MVVRRAGAHARRARGRAEGEIPAARVCSTRRSVASRSARRRSPWWYASLPEDSASAAVLDFVNAFAARDFTGTTSPSFDGAPMKRVRPRRRRVGGHVAMIGSRHRAPHVAVERAFRPAARAPQRSRRGRTARAGQAGSHLTERDPFGADELRERVQRLRHAGERRVAIDVAPRGRGRRLAAREPGLEMDPLGLEPALGAMRLGVEATDELAVVEDRHRRSSRARACGPGV